MVVIVTLILFHIWRYIYTLRADIIEWRMGRGGAPLDENIVYPPGMIFKRKSVLLILKISHVSIPFCGIKLNVVVRHMQYTTHITKYILYDVGVFL